MSGTAFLSPMSPSSELLKLEGGLGDPLPKSYLAENSVVGSSGGEVTLGSVNGRKLIMKGLELGPGGLPRGVTVAVSDFLLRRFIYLPHLSTQTIKICWGRSFFYLFTPIVPSTLSCNVEGTLPRSPSAGEVSVPIAQLLWVLAAKWLTAAPRRTGFG